MGQNRIASIDIFKGIGIILIVGGHIIPGTFPKFWLYVSTFHIPLFFFISGFLFNQSKYKNNCKLFLLNRIRTLFLPYILFLIINIIGYYVLKGHFIDNVFFTGLALWFIPVLMCCECLWFIAIKLAHDNKCLLITFVFINALISFYSSQKFGLINYNILCSFLAVYFYGIGNLFRNIIIDKVLNYNWENLFFIFILGIIFSLSYLPIESQLPEYFINKIPSMVYYVSPLGAIGLFGAFSIAIDRLSHKFDINIISNILCKCGKESYIILAFHQILCMIFIIFLPTKLAILAMIISLVILVNIIPDYFPFILGRTTKTNVKSN